MKRLSKRPSASLDREVALVAGHRVLEHLARYLEEVGIEGAGGDRGPLDEVDDLGKRLLGDHRRATQLASDVSNAVLKPACTHLVVSGNEGVLQGGQVLARQRELDGAWGQEAMSLGGAARGEPGKLHGDDVGAEQREQPADGSREARVAALPIASTSPSRGPRPGQQAAMGGPRQCRCPVTSTVA